MSTPGHLKPPRLAEWLLGWLLPDAGWQTPAGDFEEFYNEVAEHYGERRARRWYWLQVGKLLPDRLYQKAYWGIVMLKNYVMTALRNMRRHAGYVMLNVTGLGIGLTCCLLILLFVLSEYRYDRHYPAADRMYRVVQESRSPTNASAVAAAPTPMAATLLGTYPDVVDASRLSGLAPVVGYEDRHFNESRFFFADANFFGFFGVPLLSGDPRTALARPDAVVLTEATARKYFGEEDPVGKVVRVHVQPTYKVNFTTRDFVVTGVAAPMPPNTHFHFDFLASFATLQGHNEQSWMGGLVHTYFTLRPGASAGALEAQFPQLAEAYVGPYLEERFGISYDEFVAAGRGRTFALQPVTDIHFGASLDMELEPVGDVRYVYLLAAVAVFILLLSCANFVNLSTARSFRRATEVGVRKVLGSQRGQLIRQFLTESFLTVLFALVLAIGAAVLVLPVFNGLTDTQLQAGDLFGGAALVGAGLLLVLVGLLAGSYPAFFLSSMRPVVVLKGRWGGGRKRLGLRNGLVVFQFVVSMVLLVATLVIYNQQQYMVNKKLGFDEEHVVVIEGARSLAQQSDAFLQALQGAPGIARVTGFYTAPGRSFDVFSFENPGAATTGEPVRMKTLITQHDFLETLGATLASGRGFLEDRAADAASIILNETAARSLGWDEPLGRQLRFQENPLTVVGIVEDFHYESVHRPIEPLAILLPGALPEFNSAPSLILARLRPDDVAGTMAFLGAAWERFLPEQPFTYSFLDEDFEALYRSEKRAAALLGLCAALAFFIACLGLFSLAAFTVEQRTKEIGIRKVLGASTSSVVALVARAFLALVLGAFVLAAPVAYFAMTRWLEDFPYRIDLHAGVFMLVGALALLTALLAVGYQALKAARTDPVKSLRYE